MTALPRVLLWTDTPGEYVSAVERAGLSHRVALETLGRKELPSEDQRAEAVAMLGWGVPEGVLPTMPKLRWAQSLTAGVEGWLGLPDLPEGLLLTCARGTHRNSMPENILGALFHITKPYALAAESQREGKWVRRMATPLGGKTLGILGLGAIGQDVTRLASALGMRVVGTRRGGAPVAGVAEIFPPGQIASVLAQSDFVLLLLPATAETDKIINAGSLSAMKSTAWLLNFGRGHLIDDDDLIAAVAGKQIAGAILDVFREEPLAEGHAFWTTEGIQVLPHIGGGHPERDVVVADLFADNLGRFLDGRKLRELVDLSAGY